VSRCIRFDCLLPLTLSFLIHHSSSNPLIIGVRAVPASILLYGPPGCGKTKLAKAVAGEAQAAFLSIGPSDVLSKFVGESEASIKQLFEEAKQKASRMESQCAVLFFDEIDALGMSRSGGDGGGGAAGGGDSSSEHSSRRILAELLIQLTNLSDEMASDSGDCDSSDDDGACKRCDISKDACEEKSQDRPSDVESPRPISPSSSEGSSPDTPNEKAMPMPPSPFTSETNSSSKPRVIVIAATNRPEDCDPALLRRFAIRVLVGLPSQRDRKKIVSRLLVGIESTLTVVQLNELSIAMEGWSGSDLESVTREAVMAPIRECLRAAAITKMRMRKKAERKDTELSEITDANELARDELLNGFKKLRSVTMQDFEEAIAFWIGDGQDQMTAQRMNQASVCHYDSDSSLEECA